MKKMLVLLLAIVMLLGVVGCGSASTSGGKVAPEKIKTLGDAFKYTDEAYYGFGYEYFVYVFKESEDGDFYRAIAEFSEELYEKSEEIDFDDEKREEKIHELYKDVPVFKVENLSAGIPSQKELDKYIGKTGADLLNEGFITSGYALGDESSDFWMSKGVYTYAVTFDIVLNSEGDFNEEEVIKDAKILSVKYEMLSSAATDYGDEE